MDPVPLPSKILRPFIICQKKLLLYLLKDDSAEEQAPEIHLLTLQSGPKVNNAVSSFADHMLSLLGLPYRPHPLGGQKGHVDAAKPQTVVPGRLEGEPSP